MVSMIVHELRSPLSAMAAALEVCRGHAAPPAVRNAQEILARQLGKAQRLVDDLLDVPRLGRASVVALNEAEVALSRVIVGAAEELGHRIKARNQTLVLELPQAGVLIRGDTMRLGQVVANLIDNSSKYSPVGGQIAVRLSHESGFAVIRVRDEGVGISPDDQPHIFEPFFRAKGSEAAPGGLGLGLALARRLVELHGGTIEARSDGPNLGSEVIVRLPAIADRNRA